MNFSSIEFSIDQGVALIILNRPQQLNSLNQLMHDELRLALTEIRQNSEIRCLLLSAKGRAFCAGQDLSDRCVDPDQEVPDLGYSLEHNYNPLVRMLKGLQIPIICAVNGIAAGAGANLALVADLVIAARSAAFVQGFTKIGLIPDSGGSWHLPRLVGMARAKAMVLLNEKISAEQAEHWGLIWKVVNDEQLMPEAHQHAQKLATQATKGLALSLQALESSQQNTLDQQLDLERDLQRQAGQSDDYREGVHAFIEKRPACFKGH